jgi:hypothetical protein
MQIVMDILDPVHLVILDQDVYLFHWYVQQLLIKEPVILKKLLMLQLVQ